MFGKGVEFFPAVFGAPSCNGRLLEERKERVAVDQANAWPHGVMSGGCGGGCGIVGGRYQIICIASESAVFVSAHALTQGRVPPGLRKECPFLMETEGQGGSGGGT